MPGGEAPRTYPKRTQITSIETPFAIFAQGLQLPNHSDDPDTVNTGSGLLEFTARLRPSACPQ
jgi:hypothetical protein